MNKKFFSFAVLLIILVEFGFLWLLFNYYVFVPVEVKWLLSLVSILVSGLAIYQFISQDKKNKVELKNLWRNFDRDFFAIPESVRIHMPLVIVVGNGIENIEFFKLTDEVLYVHVHNPAHLALVVKKLIDYRKGSFPDSILFDVAIDDCEQNIISMVLQWRESMLGLFRYIKYSIPVFFVINYPIQPDKNKNTSEDEKLQYFGFRTMYPLVSKESLDKTITQYTCALSGKKIKSTSQQQILDTKIISFFDWFNKKIIPALYEQIGANRIKLAIQGVFIRNTGNSGDKNAAFSAYCRDKTQLTPMSVKYNKTGVGSLLPLWLYDIKSSLIVSFTWRIISYVAIVVLIGFIAAAFACTFNNWKFYEKIHSDIQQYMQLEQLQDKERQYSIERLKKHKSVLDGYHLDGEPMHLGLGFYRAYPLLKIINKLIADYKPLKKDLKIKELTLESAPLFKSGEFVLRENSYKDLINILPMVQDERYSEIIIEGHSDSTGDADKNLVLSERRAAAVRDWFVEFGNLNNGLFSIKGYGDTRPIADNDTPEGRQKNRRVKIILIPKDLRR